MWVGILTETTLSLSLSIYLTLTLSPSLPPQTLLTGSGRRFSTRAVFWQARIWPSPHSGLCRQLSTHTHIHTRTHIHTFTLSVSLLSLSHLSSTLLISKT